MPLDAPSDSRLSPLFQPLKFGSLTAPNRIWMAPLTRNRAHEDGTPGDLAAEYYRQRASAGLIISEATQISPHGKGYIDTPGIHDAGHVRKWRAVTDAVHDRDGRIFLQLWHVGRISHTSLLPDAEPPVAPSAIRANAQTFTRNGFEPVSAPRALHIDEIKGVVEQYGNAAMHAMEAGFDGVEIHAANGYLIDQFLHDGTNTRDDAYGGTARNRTRFLSEVVEAVTEMVDAGRVGVRLSPTGAFGDVSDSDIPETFGAAIEALNAHGLAYLHFVEKFASAPTPKDAEILSALRDQWKGVFVGNGAYKAESAAAAITGGRADAIAFGRPFIANPDLPERFRRGADLNRWDETTFYGGDHRGYTDYPSLDGGE